MNYRIKEITYKSGRKAYKVQYLKRGWVSDDWKNTVSFSVMGSRSSLSLGGYHSTEEGAQREIDFYEECQLDSQVESSRIL